MFMLFHIKEKKNGSNDLTGKKSTNNSKKIKALFSFRIIIINVMKNNKKKWSRASVIYM